jgi:hypothetical protein
MTRSHSLRNVSSTSKGTPSRPYADGIHRLVSSLDTRKLPSSMCMAEVAQIALYCAQQTREIEGGETGEPAFLPGLAHVVALLHRQIAMCDTDWDRKYHLVCHVVVHPEDEDAPEVPQDFQHDFQPAALPGSARTDADFSGLLLLGRLARMCELTQDLRSLVMKGVYAEFPDEGALRSVAASCCSTAVNKHVTRQLQVSARSCLTSQVYLKCGRLKYRTHSTPCVECTHSGCRSSALTRICNQ